MMDCGYGILQIQLPLNAAGRLAYRESAKGKQARRKEAPLFFSGHDYHYRELFLHQFNSNGLEVLRMVQT